MPHIDTHTTTQSVVIATWHLTETLPQLIALWGNRPLPENFTTAKSEKRQCEILSTHLLLHACFNREITLRHAPNGAPIIDDGYISISHTEQYVVIALHPTRRIGIDIERLGDKVNRVSTRFLAPAEWAALPDETATPIDGISARSIATHIAWSVKEATYKVFPSAVEFRKEIITAPITQLPSGIVTVELPSLTTTIEAHYTLYKGCSLAWVVE